MPYVSAESHDKGALYTDDQGVQWLHSGGSLAWRNNNPGNIIKGTFANNHGAIGSNGRFACFPDHATGFAAITALLQTSSYKDLSIKDGISKYAPPVENDTESYQSNLKKFTGLDTDRKLSSLTTAELEKCASAIQRVEGWNPGTIKQLAVTSENTARGEPSQFELTSTSEDQLYEHLAQVWRKGQERFGLAGDATYDFQTENGRVNLIGARGFLADTMAPCENRSSAWDDTMFVVYKDQNGGRHVDTFYLSTEPNDTKNPDHVSTLKFGMHRYYISYHHILSTYKPLKDYLANFAGKDYKYRALKPHDSGVTTFLDKSHDQTQDPSEKEIADNEINIHYGGSTNSPSGWSHGCQVLKGPTGYREFIELVESDHSIIGTIDNELAAKPAKNGTRYVIYMLVEGTYLAPPAVAFPFAGKDAAAHYALNEGGTGGYFPIGSNRFWHGGIHLDVENEPVRAIADGDVVAYRINKKPLDVTLGKETLPMSNGFVLIRHEKKTPKEQVIEFFSLYMHLLPLESYTEEQKKAPPSLFKTHTFNVATTEDGRGLNVRSAADKSTIVGVIPKDAHFDVVAGTTAAWDKSKTYSQVSYDGLSGFAYITGRATKVSGNKYQCTTSEDWPDASKLGLNVREAGKGTRVTRVIPSGEKLEFKAPGAVAPGGTLSTGWHELAEGGWVYVRGGDKPNVTHSFELAPEAYDSVKCCKIPVSAGAVLGYPGPYLATKATVHFEIFAADVEFMKNPKGDQGGQGVLKIPAGKTFKQRKSPTADLKVNLTAGARLRLLETCAGEYRKVAVDEIVGWSKRTALGDYNTKGKHYTLTAALTSLTTKAGGGETLTIDAPIGSKLVLYQQAGTDDRKVGYLLADSERDKYTGYASRAVLGKWEANDKRYTLEKDLPALFKELPEGGTTFDEDAGQNEQEILTDALAETDERVSKDKSGNVWQEVEFAAGKRGYIKITEDGVKKLSAYDWPLWTQVEESSEYSKDGICDAAALIELCDENGDGETSAAEIKKAIADKKVADKLRRVACKNPTEWAGEIQGIERLKGTPWFLSDEMIDATKEYAKKLAFWDDAADAKLPPKDAVWHFHPIGFIEQIRSLSTGVAVIPPQRKTEPVKPKVEKTKTEELSKPKLEREKPKEIPGTTRCMQHKVDELATFCHKKMLANASSNSAAFIRAALSTNFYGLAPSYEAMAKLAGYVRWAWLVRPGGDWDYKRDLVRDYGLWACDFAKRTHYNYDIWSNVIYGYVGLASGFSRNELLDAAGVAQVIALRVPEGYWRRLYDSFVSGGHVFRAFDDPADQEAIKVGFELWEKFKSNVTKAQLMAALETHSKKLQVERCEAHEEGKTQQPTTKPSTQSKPLPLEGSVGATGDNFKKDVKAVRERFHALGFNWIDKDKETSDDAFVATIKLFQSMISGSQKVSGDGRIDKDGNTHKWLQAKNAPYWLPMTATGTGIDNRERADATDTHDYCSNWLDETILAAGKHYQENYRKTHSTAAPIGVNDASLPHGGDTKDHAGHEAGLDVDIYLPRTDGKTGGIYYWDKTYDQDATRAILKAFRAQSMVNRCYFNDPKLIAEGLCTTVKNHDHHLHIGIGAPKRED